jgi:hypothetical protein
MIDSGHRKLSLLVAVILSCISLIVLGKESLLPEVPDSLPDPPRSLLKEKRSGLQSRIDDLNGRRDSYNTRCTSDSGVKQGSQEEAWCEQEQARIRSTKTELLQAIDKFKRDLEAAKSQSNATPTEDLRDAVAAPSGIPATNAENNRSAYNYARIIDQFHVSTNPKYAVAQNGDTLCNVFAEDVTSAMGAGLPRVRANEIFNWLERKGAANGWREITPDEAQRMANDGHPTLAIWQNTRGIHGHVAIVRPGSVGDPRGIAEAQSGNLIVNATHREKGFNGLSPQSIVYWYHN